MASTRKGSSERLSTSREVEQVRMMYRELFDRLAEMGDVLPGGVELIAETCHGGEFCHGGTSKSFERQELVQRRLKAAPGE